MGLVIRVQGHMYMSAGFRVRGLGDRYEAVAHTALNGTTLQQHLLKPQNSTEQHNTIQV